MKQLLAITDPYLKHSGTFKTTESGKLVLIRPEPYPWLSDMMATQSLLIHQQLPRLKPLFDDIIVLNGALEDGVECSPLFDEYEQFQFLHHYKEKGYNRPLERYDIWLCGFHYGRCIHKNIVDAVNDSYLYRGRDPIEQFKVISNLSFQFPGDTQEQAQHLHPTMARDYYWDYVDTLVEVIDRTHK